MIDSHSHRHLHALSDIWSSRTINVSGGHALHVEQSGNPDGIPLVLVHGGPGGSSDRDACRMVDPGMFRIIQFDQRGCGRSTPLASIEHNSLQHTLTDMERIREELGLDHWVLAGGSWGSTVSLAYGQAFPNRCLGICVTSVWLLRHEDIEWWYYGARQVFPEAWERYANFIPVNERADLRGAYHRRIFSSDPEAARTAAIEQYIYEQTLMHFVAPVKGFDTGNALNYGRIFSHYSVNNFFLEENQLIRDADTLKNFPLAIVGARYDMCTPVKNAFDLAKALPHARLIIAEGAGHLPHEATLSGAIIGAMNWIGDQVRKQGWVR